MGGEKADMEYNYSAMKGSPPRGRGKGPLVTGKGIDDRITPAWAGKSCFGEVCVDGLEDHPRVGGEKLGGQQLRGLFGGSPPRGRGKDLLLMFGKNSNRITPAWAGKSPALLIASMVSRDRPRVGGEKRSAVRGRGLRWGSPPRGRGKDRLSTKVVAVIRITPAWAGKS